MSKSFYKTITIILILFFAFQLLTIRVLNTKLDAMVDKFWKARDMESQHLEVVRHQSFKAGYHQALTDFSKPLPKTKIVKKPEYLPL